MNISTVSVYDNVTNSPKHFTSSFVCRTINDFLTINGDVQVKICCPLCVGTFEYKFSLFEHLRTVHNDFIRQVGDKSLGFKECPFCCAKFYGKHVAARHALTQHFKAIAELFAQRKHKSYRCVFCGRNLGRDCASVVKHLEEIHLLNFEEEFNKKFFCDNTIEVTISELLNSDIQSQITKPISKNHIDVVDEGHLHNTGLPNCTNTRKINCYDFSDLKQQLDNIQNRKESPDTKLDNSQARKPILKEINNTKNARRSVRRVLRFDLPDYDDHDKENLVLKDTVGPLKNVNLDEHSLLCHNNENEIDKYLNTANESSVNWCGEPKHSSTPNDMGKSNCKILLKDEGRSIKSGLKRPSFRSYLCQKKSTEFDFQCGKCQELFTENTDLVCHMKKNHKRFIFKALQPCYRCAICKAKFYKNYYLRKHHNLHKPY